MQFFPKAYPWSELGSAKKDLYKVLKKSGQRAKGWSECVQYSTGRPEIVSFHCILLSTDILTVLSFFCISLSVTSSKIHRFRSFKKFESMKNFFCYSAFDSEEPQPIFTTICQVQSNFCAGNKFQFTSKRKTEVFQHYQRLEML